MNKIHVFDYNNSGIDMNLWESLLEVNENFNKKELFLMYINFVINDLLTDYYETLDLILKRIEDIRENIKLDKSQKKEFRKDVDCTIKNIQNNKKEILKKINDVMDKILLELDNWKKHNEVLLEITNSISDIIVERVRNFSVSFACFGVRINSKMILDKVEAIKIYHEFACSENTISTISEIKKNIDDILTQKNVKDVICIDQGHTVSDESDKILESNTLQKQKLHKNIKDTEDVIDYFKMWIVLLIQNYPYKFSIIYKRLQVAVEQLSEMEELKKDNDTKSIIIEKQRKLIEDFRKTEKEYITLRQKYAHDTGIMRDQKSKIIDLQNQLKILNLKVKTSDKTVKAEKTEIQENKEIIDDLETQILKSLEEKDLLEEIYEQRISKLNESLMKQISINTWLNIALETSKANKGKEIEIFINNCEVDFEKCSNDELLKYIIYSNCNEEYKKETIQIILDFLTTFVLQTTKWASSSMNGNDWVWWWKYSNNFINPIINFIKQKHLNMSSQDFLEEIIYINWKKIIEQYINLDEYISKRQKVAKNVFNIFSDNDKSAFPIFRSIEYLSDKLNNITFWNTDLSVLVANIIDTLNSNYVKNTIHSRFVTVAEKIKQEKEDK